MKTVKIVYEDSSLMVIDKPSGMLVTPATASDRNDLTSYLNHELDKRGEGANAYPCHRIDRDTSGLVIFAKGKKNQRLVMDQFRDGTVRKAYIAFARGDVRKSSGVINEPIMGKNNNRLEKAVTEYEVLDRKGDFTVLLVRPLTGKTNQIRIHLSRIGYPLLGESVYARKKDAKVRFGRAALHAACLEFSHPANGGTMVFNAQLHEDMLGLAGRDYMVSLKKEI